MSHTYIPYGVFDKFNFNTYNMNISKKEGDVIGYTGRTDSLR